MLGVDERDLDAVGVDHAALVAADDFLAVEPLGAQPDAYLVIADDRRLGPARDFDRVMDVVEVTVRDQH